MSRSFIDELSGNELIDELNNSVVDDTGSDKPKTELPVTQKADSFVNSLAYVLVQKSTYLTGIILSIILYKIIDLIFGSSSVKTPIAIVVVAAIFLAVIILRTRARMAKHPTPEMQSFRLHK